MRTAVLVSAVLAACVSQAPDPAQVSAREYRRENARVEAIEEFIERQRECAARGGAMQVPRTTSGRLPPAVSELRLASCGSRHLSPL